MFEVKILKPDGVEWVDHLGNNISELVFSKKYHKNYVPGYYPLESAGSLYRNIDNFRESPLQSRTDWEIRIPSVFTLDGVKTVDLLYWLEEANGGNFELIGCEARLYKDDEPEPIYIGVVESVVSGNSLTSSIRISDWIGNPKAGISKFSTGVGLTELTQQTVEVTQASKL